MTWLGAGGWVAFLSKMQSEDVLVRLRVNVLTFTHLREVLSQTGVITLGSN